MARHRATSVALFFAVVSPGIWAVTFPAAAEDVPESMRIEQKALKDYSQNPVVPIDRGNAHHRDLGGSGGDGASPDQVAPALPDATAPPPAQSNPNGGASQ
ncbi:hypothetical protein [Hyphomicrobium denitrificans]|nr:hypothetical protein [Hyphomicrobium denitrificans]